MPHQAADHGFAHGQGPYGPIGGDIRDLRFGGGKRDRLALRHFHALDKLGCVQRIGLVDIQHEIRLGRFLGLFLLQLGQLNALHLGNIGAL